MPELMADARFNTTEAIMANWVEGSVLVTKAIAAHPLAYWKERLQTLRGQWAPYQNLMEVSQDQQVIANDLLFEVEAGNRSEEHTSELQSLMRISYAVFCLKKKKYKYTTSRNNTS